MKRCALLALAVFIAACAEQPLNPIEDVELPVAMAVVDDNTPPTIIAPPDVTLEFPADITPANTGFALVTDDIDPNPIITFSDTFIPGTCSAEFTILRVWTATDFSGNTASAVQVITVLDTQAPLLIVPADVILQAGESTDPSNTGLPFATDNSGEVIVTYSDADQGTGVIIRTWTATDGCGNMTVGIQVITVPTVQQVSIDIKPGSDPNSINLGAENEVISVAILSTNDFDATSVDHTTLEFEGASEIHVDMRSGEARRHEEDVDEDGDMDLVIHVRVGDTGLDALSTEGTLTGETFDGTSIQGTDAVNMIG